MAISSNLLQRLRDTIIESTATANQESVSVVNPDGSNISGTKGQVTNGTSVSGVLNSLPLARYNASPTARTEGQYGVLQEDVSGNVNVNIATKLSGEDQTVDVLKVEHRYTATRAVADTQIKASAGFVHTVSIAPSTATPTAGLFTLYDNTAESGTQIYSEWVFATTPGHTILLDVSTGTGIYAGRDGTLANVSFTVTWR